MIREMGFQLLAKRRIVYRSTPITKAMMYEIFWLSAILLPQSRNNMVIKLYQLASLILGRILKIEVISITPETLDLSSGKSSGSS